MAICAGVACVGAGTGAIAAFLHHASAIPVMDNYDPPQMTVLLDREGASFARLFEEQRRVVPLREMPPHLPEAFMAIEDTDFAHHAGINPKAIARAAVANLRHRGAAQGASTITQQLPRNLPLGIGREKTLERKVRESLMALQLERMYSKDQILEVYLNQIYLGSGTYGVEAASRLYFGKTVRDLDRAEVALLAGLPQLPEKYSPLNNPERARERRNMVLGRLHDLGWIEDGEYAQCLDAPVRPVGPPTPVTQPDAQYFADAARAELQRATLYDDKQIRAEGLRVQTTMDPWIQQCATRTMAAGIAEEEKLWIEARQPRAETARRDPAWWARPAPGQMRIATVVRIFPDSLVVEIGDGWRADLAIPAATRDYFTTEAGIVEGAGVDVEITEVESGPRKLWTGRLLPQKQMQGALVCLDRRTGEVRALVGGRSWGDQRNDGFFNRAIRARRQAGSTLKPLFFAAALESGYEPESLLSDTPLEFGNGYAPKNYDNQFHGVVSMQRAMEQSFNVPTMRLVQAMGLRRALARVHAYDMIDGESDWELPMEMPVILGTTDVTPMELATAYQVFANGGTALPPTMLSRITRSDGREMNLPAREEVRILDSETAAQMTQMFMGVMSHGSGRHVREVLPPAWQDAVGGKSGTTNDNRDAWFAGFTPNHTIVVWIGFDRPLPMGEERTGGRVAGPLWGRFVAEAFGSQPPQPAHPFVPEGWRLELASSTTGNRVLAPDATAGGDLRWRAVPAYPDEEPAAIQEQAKAE